MLWSTLFKYNLELGHYEEAYEAMMANPDPVRSDVCASVHTQYIGVHFIHIQGWHWLTCVKCVHTKLEIS